MVTFKAVRGMNDLFEPELSLWRHMESLMVNIFTDYGFEEIRTPVLEDLRLFERGVGEHTDMVEKEMFIIEDGDHRYALRGENTAPLVRALIEKGGLSSDFNKKFFYIGPQFRKERPQKGRLRQFHQFGLESFGTFEPMADVEIIVLVNHLFNMLGLKGITLKLNSLGKSFERAIFKDKLKEFLSNHRDQLCEDCQRRMEHNTLRVLDCKKASCQLLSDDGPKSIDFLEKESSDHFAKVTQGLSEQGIHFVTDHKLVRGLDYYERTVFEFVADIGLGAQNTLCGGGRYDGLFQTLGEKASIPAIGCAGGIERIALLLGEKIIKPETPKLAIISADEEGANFIPALAFSLRNLGIAVDFSLSKKSLKSQMRRADKISAENVLVIGKDEINKNEGQIKSFSENNSIIVKLNTDNIYDVLKR